MSLPDVLTVLIEKVGNEITDYLTDFYPDRATPERALRYHGSRQMPQDCCTEAGYVVGNWVAVGHTTTKGQQAQRAAGVSGFPGTMLVVRYVTCWPDSEDGLKTRDPEWDATSAMLGGLAEAVARALICFEEKPDEELKGAGCRGYQFVSAEPINPADVCAGVAWTSTVSLTGRGNVP